MNRALLFTAFLAAILLVGSCQKNTTPPPVVVSPYIAVDKVLTDSIPLRFDSRGFVLISVNGKTVYSKSFGGYKDSTVEPVSFCSQWLSGAVLMSLVDEGKLQLSDTIGKFMPVFSQYHKGNITMAQLFSHMSGFPGSSSQGYENNQNLTLSQCTDSIAKNVALIAPPGKQFDFGNVSMQVAGRVCEVVTSQKWGVLFSANIGIPCGMINTNYGLGLNPSVAGGAVSSPRDYSLFLNMISNNGIALNGARILSQASVTAMEQGQTGPAAIVSSPYPKSLLPADNFYGIGNWRDLTAPGDSLIECSSPGAFGSHPWINPGKKIAGIIFTYAPNQPNGATMATCLKIRSLVRTIVK